MRTLRALSVALPARLPGEGSPGFRTVGSWNFAHGRGACYCYGDPNIPDVRRFASKLELQHELHLPGRKAFDQLAVTRQSELASHVELTDALRIRMVQRIEALDSKLKQRSFVVHRNGLHDANVKIDRRR